MLTREIGQRFVAVPTRITPSFFFVSRSVRQFHVQDPHFVKYVNVMEMQMIILGHVILMKNFHQSESVMNATLKKGHCNEIEGIISTSDSPY